MNRSTQTIAKNTRANTKNMIDLLNSASSCLVDLSIKGTYDAADKDKKVI